MRSSCARARRVLLHGERAIPGTVLGLPRPQRRAGIAFMGTSHPLANADEYERGLLEEGCVIADFASAAPKSSDCCGEASRQKARWRISDLLDEVTALVEHPSVYVGSSTPVPERPAGMPHPHDAAEPEIFPAVRRGGKLLPKFLIVSNMRVADPRHIIGGNERVVRPRLEDARFFYDQDRKTRLEDRVPQLAKVSITTSSAASSSASSAFSSLRDTSRARSARSRAADARHGSRKADLVTGMVGEFPELQGTMGRYYALHDGEPKEVADAIEAHYRPRFAGDRCPKGRLLAQLRLRTSWTHSPACSASASSRRATRIRLDCAVGAG
jgi:glycyl-tRNA synthetase beta chain